MIEARTQNMKWPRSLYIYMNCEYRGGGGADYISDIIKCIVYTGNLEDAVTSRIREEKKREGGGDHLYFVDMKTLMECKTYTKNPHSFGYKKTGKVNSMIIDNKVPFYILVSYYCM